MNLLAEFADGDMLSRAARIAAERGYRILDAFSPAPVTGLAELLNAKRSRIRPVMLASGVVVALLTYGVQWWSAVHAYPIDSGGRPLNSWPVFVIVPFEVGMLAATLCGVITMFVACGFPRLHHPVLDVPGFERASIDRFFLLVETAPDVSAHEIRQAMEGSGALMVSEVRT
jgi:hypothetical protein